MPKLDKIWMALASYNLGFVNINLARERTKKRGGNPNQWSDVSIYLNEILIERYADESNEFEKHVQALEYVQRIQLYYQTLSILNREKEMYLLAIN